MSKRVSPTITPSPSLDKKSKWKKLLEAIGLNSLLISVLVHFFFIALATVLVVEVFQKKHQNFQEESPAPQNTDVEYKVEIVKRNSVESAPPDLKRITTTSVAAITLPDPPEISTISDDLPQTMSGLDGISGMTMGQGMGAGMGLGSPGSGAFGATDGSGLQGYFIDFKQTKDKQPTGMSEGKYLSLLAKYVEDGWDDDKFTPYYKSQNPLYATAFAISTRPSAAAPAAFHLENEVQPGLWIVHYHGKVSGPTGDYRLEGFGDNVLMVKIDGQTVLDGGWDSLSKKKELRELLPYKMPSYIASEREDRHIANLKIGLVFHLNSSVPVDMDVLIGDCGGVCSFFLLAQNVSETYEKQADGTPVVPFFQLGDRNSPNFSSSEEHPPFSTTAESWQFSSDNL